MKFLNIKNYMNTTEKSNIVVLDSKPISLNIKNYMDTTEKCNISVVLDSDDTISTLTSKVMEKLEWTDLPRDGLVLLYHGRNLLDKPPTDTVRQCDIRGADHTVHFGLKGPVTVRVYARLRCARPGWMVSNWHDIEVDCMDTVRVLKRKIKKRTGVPPEKQCIVSNRFRTIHADDRRRLLEFGIVRKPEESECCVLVLFNDPSLMEEIQ